MPRTSRCRRRRGRSAGRTGWRLPPVSAARAVRALRSSAPGRPVCRPDRAKGGQRHLPRHPVPRDQDGRHWRGDVVHARPDAAGPADDGGRRQPGRCASGRHLLEPDRVRLAGHVGSRRAIAGVMYTAQVGAYTSDIGSQCLFPALARRCSLAPRSCPSAPTYGHLDRLLRARLRHPRSSRGAVA